LTVSSGSGGSVTAPGEGSFLYGDQVNVSIQATPIANYHFVNWTGTAVDAGKVADPDSASTTITPDADYTLHANFAIDQHDLTTSSGWGGSVSTPGEGTYTYDHGTLASVAASADTGFHFVNWTGTAVDAGKVANAGSASTSVTMDAAYAIQANFAIDQHTLTASSSTGGSVSSPGEGSFEYDNGTDVSIQATAADNYYFINWTGTAVTAGKVANPNAAGTTVAVDASYTVRANFGQQDGVAPTLANLAPASGSIQAPLDSLIVLHVTDAGIGVDADSVEITLDGAVIYTGDTSAYNSAGGICRRSGTAADYTYAYQADELFDFDQLKTVTVNAADIGGVVMDQQSYSFRTEMRSFGENKQVSVALDSVANEAASTVCDSSGNIWAVWHAGAAGSRDIYLGKLTAGADSFGASVCLTTNVQSITGVDDVSIVLPAGACPYDVTISITKVANPHDCTLPFLNGYEFSPSGLEFNSPVTITIPYAVSGAASTPTPYWYNSLTDTLSQQKIDNIEIIEISASLHALRFTTTHLTPYYALLGAETSDDGTVELSPS